MLPCRRTGPAGQASLEYVGVLAVVALMLVLAGGAAAGPALAAEVTGAVRAAICRVAGAVCTTEDAEAAGMAPCPVHVRSDEERVGATVQVVHVGREDSFTMERRSDGSVAVTFGDGVRTGVEAVAGIAFTPLRATGAARIGAGVRFAGGRTWEFPTAAAAEAFVARFAGTETMSGEAIGLARRLCPWCEEAPAPHAPDVRFLEGGRYLEATADAAVPAGGRRLDAAGAAESLAVLGRRVERSGTTWYLRLTADAAADLGLVVGSLGAAGASEAVLEVTRRGGRAVAAAVRTSAAFAGKLDLPGIRADLGSIARRLGSGTAAGRLGGGAGARLEARVGLDLTDPANAAAVAGVLQPASPRAWAGRLHALGVRLDAAGEVDLTLSRETADRTELEAGGGLGAGLHGAYARTRRTRSILGAWSLRRGGPLLDRDDCVQAA